MRITASGTSTTMLTIFLNMHGSGYGTGSECSQAGTARRLE
jgi:hypothetical protein